ncbi:large conductance mechanosensitive channel protein MscL [Micropruina sonneratiae]|uniref:large conductance mechanosensitive channel protein MscL n=1 Tax=Micropruina sonneratiae TaxID=2986940 RepID=UPI002226086D|nr:large conductance mechanosensitive channel protein MscL [Micropruina sp. KQZ13P-5]MCW3158905.1 large conductance mechanosensitive channel protein MscL [Micropruina sp. KQZ13P-5]
MLKGFRDFLMRGNLIDIAVAFVIGGAFSAVTTSFTQIVVEVLARLGGAPNFDEWRPFGFSSIGPFLTALVAFIIMAFVVYFGIVVPYEKLKALTAKSDTETEPGAPTTEELLIEIRDLLAKNDGTPKAGPTITQ